MQTSCRASVWRTYARVCVAARQYINTLCVFTVHTQSSFLFLSLKASSSSLFKTQTLSCIFTATRVNHQCWLYSFSCPPCSSREEETQGLLCMMLFSERLKWGLCLSACVVRDGIEHDTRSVQASDIWPKKTSNSVGAISVFHCRCQWLDLIQILL